MNSTTQDDSTKGGDLTPEEIDSIKLSQEEAQKLDWWDEALMQIEGLEEAPYIKFFKNGEDEIYVGEDNRNADSSGYVSIGETGVSEDWEGFIEEVQEVRG